MFSNPCTFEGGSDFICLSVENIQFTYASRLRKLPDYCLIPSVLGCLLKAIEENKRLTYLLLIRKRGLNLDLH